jgi:hypothetical protein
MGVEFTSPLILIETEAQNLDPPIPDPFPPDHRPPNSLDVREVASLVPDIGISDGREFVCNCASWAFLENLETKKRGYLFAHVPLFQDIACENDVALITTMCREILNRFE